MLFDIKKNSFILHENVLLNGFECEALPLCRDRELLSESGMVMRIINLVFLLHTMRSVYDTVICLRGSHTVAWSLYIYLLHFAKAKLVCLRLHKC